MNVSLPPDLEAFVEARIRDGLNVNSDDVVQYALRLLAQQAKSPGADLDAEIDAGLTDIREGRVHSRQEVYDELKSRRAVR